MSSSRQRQRKRFFTGMMRNFSGVASRPFLRQEPWPDASCLSSRLLPDGHRSVRRGLCPGDSGPLRAGGPGRRPGLGIPHRHVATLRPHRRNRTLARSGTSQPVLLGKHELARGNLGLHSSRAGWLPHKTEGDLRAPAGVFGLGPAFGRKARAENVVDQDSLPIPFADHRSDRRSGLAFLQPSGGPGAHRPARLAHFGEDVEGHGLMNWAWWWVIIPNAASGRRAPASSSIYGWMNAQGTSGCIRSSSGRSRGTAALARSGKTSRARPIDRTRCARKPARVSGENLCGFENQATGGASPGGGVSVFATAALATRVI